MNTVKLPEICDIQYGYAFDSAQFSTSEGLPLIRIRDIVRGYSETFTAEKCSDEYVVNNGDILIGMDGEFNIAKWQGGKALLNQRVCKLIPKTVCSGYLFYYMPTALKRIEDKTAFVTVKHLSAKELNKVEVPLPPIEQQQHIAAVLDKVGELIDLRKRQLAKLDELVKSRFVEMFGDQGNNSLGFTVGKLSDVAEIFLGLTHTPTYVESGKPFLSVRDISSGSIDFSACHYITEEEFKSLPNGARPHVGDMLFCRVGTIGKPVIIPTGTPEFGTFVSIGYLRKKDNVNNLYLKSWMENEYFMKQVYDNVAGASQINLNTGWLKNFRILIPPIELQNQFAAFVEQIDMQKSTIQQSLGKLETLKKALMQEYFG